MCRWVAYIGEPIFIADLVSAPEHSLIAQARQAEECKTTINADGFGLAWYNYHRQPGLYRDVYPAWSDMNLRALAEQVSSRLFMAHVRASTGTAISRNNCHPFAHSCWSFMHNGQIGGFDAFRKRADMAIPDALYTARKGATDSEALFLIALGQDLEKDPFTALQRALKILHQMSTDAGAKPSLRMSLAISDGESLFTLRYASDDNPPSLYYRKGRNDIGWCVVSEPLERDETWISVEPNTFSHFTPSSVTHHQFQIKATLAKAL